MAVGKSITSRVLQALLSRWPDHPRVEVVTTDGFLYPLAELEKQGLMNRKGFPESYDLQHLLQVLFEIKSGKRHVKIPIYSHHHYDILPNKYEIIDQPDILILEGLNILQTSIPKKADQHPAKIFVSDFFDFSLFVDANMEIIQQWYIDRVLSFWHGAFRDSQAYFHYLTAMNEGEVREFAANIWQAVNAVNLLENILPFKNRAQLILEKAQDHSVQTVYLRKL